MRTKRRPQPKSDQFIFLILLLGIIIVVAAAFLIPVTIIGNVIGDAIGGAVLLFAINFTSWLFSIDSSGRRRVKGGPYGTKWISRESYTAALCATGLLLFAYFTVLHPLVQLWATDYVVQMGRDAGVPILLSAIGAILLSLYNLYRSLA
ncbi:MAG: hypothetical protein RTV41_14195 [Candidatus Thorarchaeota archaeon]